MNLKPCRSSGNTVNLKWKDSNVEHLKKWVTHIIGRTYKPWLQHYLSRSRSYAYRGMTLTVPQSVFHPGFFFSTRYLLRKLVSLPLNRKKFLELGAGSGLISIEAARQGAIVTATDINPASVECIRLNSLHNQQAIRIVEADLFEGLEPEAFDVVAINPPYYKKHPLTAADLAWYCGERGEYFDRLFKGLRPFMHQHSEVLMVLCEGCDLSMIKAMAASQGFTMSCLQEKTHMLEKNFIFKIIPVS